MVVHRLLAELGDEARPHVVGAVLVSDGDRTAGTAAQVSGAPAAPARTRGVVPARLRPAADVPTADLPVAVHSVCTKGDLVCDLRRNPVRSAVAVHRGYGAGAGADVLRAVAHSLVRRGLAWPRPAEDSGQLVPVGQEFTRQLPVRVARGRADTVVWEDVQGLPALVTLSPDGVLSGKVRRTGTWEISYRVRNTDPVTTSTPGTLTLTGVETEDLAGTVSAGGESSCEVRADSTAWCWGNNPYGQVGDGTAKDRVRPRRVVSATDDWTSISSGGSTTCGIRADKSLWCWGVNHRGQLGIGEGPRRFSPQQVGDDHDWSAVSTSWTHTCGVRTDGTAWCWGDNHRGQLGHGSTKQRFVPVQVGSGTSWDSITTGGWHTCATRTDGSAWCWGQGVFGQLGDGGSSTRLSPVRVSSTLRFERLTAGWSSTCGLDDQGAAWCWGINDQGQLGDGTTQLRRTPVAVAGGHRFVSLSMGDGSACGVDQAGSLWCWGANRYGQLGVAQDGVARAPVQAAGDQTWSAIDVGWYHACAVAVDRTVSCWGNNEQGQLGLGDRSNRDSPAGSRTGRLAVLTRSGRGDPRNFVATTFNLLGSQHTEVGGGTPNWAPGRLRSEWTANLVAGYGSGIVGFQEIQADQLRTLQGILGNRFSFWPGEANGNRGVWTTMMWDHKTWEKLGAESVEVPFLGKTRPNPLVLLRHRATGQRVWVFNVHNSARQIPERERERRRAMRIEARKINEKRQLGDQVLFMGDLNEHKDGFCAITGWTDLKAVNGGRNGKRCRPPAKMRVDWIFVSPKVGVRSFRFDKSAHVDRITDHTLVSGSLTLP
jgi:alpha-tubulin suppressor-like RCC1 family protein/endonuclease/exonuclease/phosphatase family metal-dependent hydrolase